MKIHFKDGTSKDFPFDAYKAARLIHLSQKKDGDVPYKVELDPALSLRERKRQVAEIQWYIDQLRVKNR